MLEIISSVLGGIKIAEKILEYAPRFKRAWEKRLAQRTRDVSRRGTIDGNKAGSGWARRYIENYEYVDDDVLRKLYEEVWIRQVSGTENYSHAAVETLPKCSRTTLEDLVRLADYAWEIEGETCLVSSGSAELMTETGLTQLRMDNLEDRGIVRPRGERTIRVERLQNKRTGVISAHHQGRAVAIGVSMAGWGSEWELPIGETHLTGVGKELVRLGRGATGTRGLAMARRVWGERRILAVGHPGESVQEAWDRVWSQMGLENLERVVRGRRNLVVHLVYRRIDGPEAEELLAVISSSSGYSYTQHLALDPIVITIPNSLVGELVEIMVARSRDAMGVKKTIRVGADAFNHLLVVPTDTGMVKVKVAVRVHDGESVLLGSS